jgi:hypothetical protein
VQGVLDDVSTLHAVVERPLDVVELLLEIVRARAASSSRSTTLLFGP